jgi:hypothetical protein
MKLGRLWKRGPGDTETLEDLLLDLANARGARIVTRHPPPAQPLPVLPETELSNAELAAGILLRQNLDRPQMLRLAAQLISAGAVDLQELKRHAVQERIEPILAALALQALKVEPGHEAWQNIAAAFPRQPVPREPIAHYSRLAEPIHVNGRVIAGSWRLVR